MTYEVEASIKVRAIEDERSPKKEEEQPKRNTGVVDVLSKVAVHPAVAGLVRNILRETMG
jgi:hypothetical protein